MHVLEDSGIAINYIIIVINNRTCKKCVIIHENYYNKPKDTVYQYRRKWFGTTTYKNRRKCDGN